MKRKFKIKFERQSILTNSISEYKISAYKSVTDSYLLSVLHDIQSYFDFDIVSIDFNDCFKTSSIVIKCTKQDKEYIFLAFLAKLEKYITNVSY